MFMQKYQFTGHLSPLPPGVKLPLQLSGDVYLASEVDADTARWTNARDVWAAGDKRKDGRITELQKRLFEAESAMLLRHDAALAKYVEQYPTPITKPDGDPRS